VIYLLFKDGLLNGDIQKLMFHSGLRRADEAVVRSLGLLGARVTKELKDATPNRNKFRKPHLPPAEEDEGNDFSRYVTVVKQMLEDHVKGQLDPQVFPYIKPELAPTGSTGGGADSTASLRSAKPTWARFRLSVVEPRQRVIVFVAGGTTFSEARACYEVSKQSVRDIFLGSSHMLSPNLFLTQLQGLSEHRDALKLPIDAPKKVVPAHLLEPDPLPKPTPPPVQQTRPPPTTAATAPAAVAAVRPPTKEMGGLKVHHQPNRPYYEEDKKKKKKKFGVF
jgi:syntaxin-binding protein 1